MQIAANDVNEIFVLAIFALSFNLLAGYAGQLSVAHAAFGAIGGYTLALLVLHDRVSLVVGALVGLLVAAAAGLMVGAAVIRLSSEWLMLLTFAVQIVVTSVTTASSALGGTYGLQGVSGLSVLGLSLDQPTSALPMFGVLAIMVYGVCHRLGESPYGRVLRGIRDDDIAARSLGKNLARHKLTIFAVSSGMAGLAGTLMVAENGLASSDMFNVQFATVIVSAVVIGGRGNLIGSVVGASLIVLSTPFLQDVVRLTATTASLWQLVVYGSALIAVLLLRPQGLLPEGASLRRRRERPPVAAASCSTRVTPTPEPEGERARACDDIVLEVRDLSKRFGGIAAVDGLDLVLRRGTVSALVGPNGAGKTTMFNLLTGAIRPDTGTVMLGGRDVVGLSPDQVARLGMVRSYQDVRLFPRLSLLDNVALAVPQHSGERLVPLFLRPGRVRADEDAARAQAMDWLTFVGLAELADVRAAELSFGQQKLAALARVLATDAELLLLDEPASGVDAQWIDPILELIEKSRAQGRTVCIVEHNLEIVERVAGEVHFMELGRITAQGTFTELTSQRRLAESYFGL